MKSRWEQFFNLVVLIKFKVLSNENEGLIDMNEVYLPILYQPVDLSSIWGTCLIDKEPSQYRTYFLLRIYSRNANQTLAFESHSGLCFSQFTKWIIATNPILSY